MYFDVQFGFLDDGVQENNSDDPSYCQIKDQKILRYFMFCNGCWHQMV